MQLPAHANPFSRRNVARARAALAGRAAGRAAGRPAVSQRSAGSAEPQFVYFRFDPRGLERSLFQQLEHDSTVQLLDIPFANMALYTDEFALDTQKAEQLRDGSVYGVTPLANAEVLHALGQWPALHTQYLDTLVQVAEADTALQFQALREAGTSEQQLARFRLCFFKKPHGTVYYDDSQLGGPEPVRHMQVWSLFFGIPIWTYSDDNGNYEINWRYSFGTLMGTRATNGRVTVKPLDTHNALSIVALPAQFVVGSLHVEGLVSSCELGSGKNFVFGGHTQVRFWSQLLNAYYFHDQYCQNEGIAPAPRQMVCYAHWSGEPGTSAVTPMLGHMPVMGASVVTQYLNLLTSGNAGGTIPNFVNLLFGVLPDMGFDMPADKEPPYYCSNLTQTAMHELSHASHYVRVGDIWWQELIERTLTNPGQNGPNPYGDPSDYLDVAESWAQFLGTNYALRRYPVGSMKATNGIPGGVNPGYFDRIDNLLENEFYFFPDRWIPYGCYHDFMDDTRVAPNNPAETWDVIQGVTIRQLYEAHNYEINSMCRYRQNFTYQNPGLNRADVDNIFIMHNVCPYS